MPQAALQPETFVLALLPEGVDPAILDDPEADFPELEQVTCRVIWPDQLRGEVEAPKHGITNTMGGGLSTVWCWANLVRTGRTRDKFQTFRSRVVMVDKISADQDDQEDTEDPT